MTAVTRSPGVVPPGIPSQARHLVDAADLVEVVAHLRQVVCVKG